MTEVHMVILKKKIKHENQTHAQITMYNCPPSVPAKLCILIRLLGLLEETERQLS